MKYTPVIVSNFPSIYASIDHLETLTYEKCLFFLISNNQEIVCCCSFSSYSAGQIEINVRQLFKIIFELNIAKIILIHNHPSGICYPSEADLSATALLQELAHVFSFKLLDHIVIAPTEYFSFAEAGILE